MHVQLQTQVREALRMQKPELLSAVSYGLDDALGS